MKRSYSKNTQRIKQLKPLEHHVTQDCGTEPPFDNAYWNHHEEGIYVDLISGEPLFSSIDKYDSGTGWPSFSRPLEADHIVEKTDTSLGRTRTEVRSHYGDAHLGHVFPDGPEETGLRYCINSASLRFISKEKLVEEGYEDYVSLFTKSSEKAYETALLAGGCFWGMQELFRQHRGVIQTRVGYTGGNTANPVYDQVKTGTTGHAEALEIIFNPEQISYEQLLEFFFQIHDPSTLNQQGNDRGTQYRSAIFYFNETQKNQAQKIINALQASRHWPQPIVTQLVSAGPFYLAEKEHQDYLQRYPNGYTCHYIRPEWKL